jgi:hypothetical protein
LFNLASLWRTFFRGRRRVFVGCGTENDQNTVNPTVFW